jgi:hypothetical protein
MTVEAASAPAPTIAKQGAFKDKEKPSEVRLSNIVAAKGTPTPRVATND